MVSDFKANEILAHLMAGNAIPKIGTLYLGLCAGEPVKSTGAIVGEPSGMEGYARKQITGDKVYFKDPAGAEIKNNADIIMFVAKEAMGTMNYWFVSDSEEGGTAIVWDKLTNRNTNEDGLDVANETVPVFYIGELKLEIKAAGEATAST